MYYIEQRILYFSQDGKWGKMKGNNFFLFIFVYQGRPSKEVDLFFFFLLNLFFLHSSHLRNFCTLFSFCIILQIWLCPQV